MGRGVDTRMKLKCLCCGGEYETEQDVNYYHVCPPIFDEARGEWVKRDCHRDERVDRSDPEKILSEGAGVEEVRE